MQFKYADGATPLDPDEIGELKPKHITTQNELNEWEAANILKAENWLFATSHHKDILTLEFIRLLHKKMFGDTWKWAGTFRNTEKNIGVTPSMITTKLKNLLDDVRCQIKNKSYLMDKIAYIFHHRLVFIHPFPNGNGRHTRMMTDFLLIQEGKSRFTWGTINLVAEGPLREEYINALKKADKQDYTALAAFIRS